jgi:hypothetical protein
MFATEQTWKRNPKKSTSTLSTPLQSIVFKVQMVKQTKAILRGSSSASTYPQSETSKATIDTATHGSPHPQTTPHTHAQKKSKRTNRNPTSSWVVTRAQPQESISDISNHRTARSDWSSAGQRARKSQQQHQTATGRSENEWSYSPVVNGEAAEAPTPGTAASSSERRRQPRRRGGTENRQRALTRSEDVEEPASPSWIRVAAAQP